MIIFGFKNNGRRQWCSRGGTRNAGDAVPPNDVRARGKGDTVAFPQKGLQKCKVCGKS